MNCNCIPELNKKLEDKHRPQAGSDVKSECTDLALCFGASVTSELLVHFKLSASMKPYNTKKGFETFVTASYCPFCGASTKPKEATGSQQ